MEFCDVWQGSRSERLSPQEFDNREAAEESVAKYHEGYFMGNKIRVEISHGGGRTAKYSGDPGACFKCGQLGHWARFVYMAVLDAIGSDLLPRFIGSALTCLAGGYL